MHLSACTILLHFEYETQISLKAIHALQLVTIALVLLKYSYFVYSVLTRVSARTTRLYFNTFLSIIYCRVYVVI